MQKFICWFFSSVLFLIGCQPQTGNTNANLVNTMRTYRTHLPTQQTIRQYEFVRFSF